QVFVVPYTGTYKVELWGASDRYANQTGIGIGGYVSGLIYLESNKIIYIYVGGNIKSFNGGITMTDARGIISTSGGATDIRITSGQWDNFESLKSRIIISAGGGTVSHGGVGGYGGGLIGYDGIPMLNSSLTGPETFGTGSTQTMGGKAGYFNWSGGGPTNGLFGIGGKGNDSYGGSGGGGYYGGGGSGLAKLSKGGGGGGSSFISGHNGCDAIASDSTKTNIIHTHQPNHYSGKTFSNTTMIDGLGYNWTNVKGNQTQMPKPDGTLYPIGQGHIGNGYAKITLISKYK
ncbi:MAG: glycine rich domain-containing protein, partial [Bacilli bacterium]